MHVALFSLLILFLFSFLSIVHTQSGEIVSVDSPVVEPGESVTITGTFSYSFPNQFHVVLELFKAEDMPIGLEDETLGSQEFLLEGDGSESFSFSLTAPSSDMEWDLVVMLSFYDGVTWILLNEHVFTVTVASAPPAPISLYVIIGGAALVVVAGSVVIYILRRGGKKEGEPAPISDEERAFDFIPEDLLPPWDLPRVPRKPKPSKGKPRKGARPRTGLPCPASRDGRRVFTGREDQSKKLKKVYKGERSGHIKSGRWEVDTCYWYADYEIVTVAEYQNHKHLCTLPKDHSGEHVWGPELKAGLSYERSTETIKGKFLGDFGCDGDRVWIPKGHELRKTARQVAKSREKPYKWFVDKK